MPTLLITLSNKPTLLPEALASVAKQTRRDVTHVVELDVGQFPKGTYPPAVFMNRVIAERSQPTDYLAWLSDDDVLEAEYVEILAGFLDAHPEVGACYGGSKIYTYRPGEPERYVRDLPAQRTFTVGAWPSCQIDGGQMLVRRQVLDYFPRPWVPEVLTDCNIADGSFMDRVAAVTPIVPVVGSWVMRNRQTPESSHWRLVGDTPQLVTAETVRRLGGG